MKSIKEKYGIEFILNAGRVEAKDKQTAYFFNSLLYDSKKPLVDTDGEIFGTPASIAFAVYGDELRQTDAPKWIVDKLKTWYKTTAPTECYPCTTYLALFEGWLFGQKNDGLKIYDADGEQYDDDYFATPSGSDIVY